MNRVFERFVLALLIGGLFFSCKQGATFKVEGKIGSAKGDTLYLEHRGLGGIVLLDSAVLKENGSFAFKQPAPQNPEFYQLRIGNQRVVFTVDSSETLHLQADALELYHSFTIVDSPTNDQLREVDALTNAAAGKITGIENLHKAKSIDDMTFIAGLDTVLTDYKAKISRMILGNPSSAAAYYAVFQKINDYLIFDPYDKKDYAMFGAVATSWNRYYPGTERTKHLYEFAMNALKARKQQEQQARLLEKVPVETVTRLPDIVLRDMNGDKKALSSLQGKVVLLDFVIYNADFSPKHNMGLNAVYSQYRSRGFEIYQISFDSDEHFWKTAADNLPWITVRDPQSVNTRLLSMYNVREIPTGFILNREGDIVARIEDYSKLSNELNKVL
ncbi:MAG: TlpA disulfide reductase family protein [Proteiniphilum sp.]|nr:TlpA disulfide reductase family protein [Proteiniphilum sp.]MDD3908971.1 TlpA disulfide reductase family protein [Proteiniphilum sp.]